MRSSKSPARVTSNQDEKASIRSRPSGRPDSPRWIGSHGQLVLGQLDHERHDRLGRRSGGRRHLALAEVGAGRLVAVVAVGHHHRRRLRRLLHRPDRGRVVDDPELVADAVVVDRLGIGRGARVTKVALSPSLIDRPQMGDRLARVAFNRSSRSLLALGRVCSWGRMSEALASSMPSAPMTPLVARPSGRGHPVGVEGWCRVAPEDPGLLPLLELAGRHWRSGRARPGGPARAARPGPSWRCAGRRGGRARRGR